MQSISRRHHYVSEFYLNGFTEISKKNKILNVVDLEEKKYFNTSPDNVAVIRDFNRLSVENTEPDILEKIISKLESKVARVIKNICLTHILPKEEDLEILYNFIALFTCRNPIQRDIINKYISDVSNQMLDKIYESKENWEAYHDEMRKNGYYVDPNANYDELKAMVKSRKLKWKASNNLMFKLDMPSMNAVLHTLQYRKWTLISNDSKLTPFITSDNPVSLSWARNFKTQYPPGFAMPSTELLFPLSKSLALIGTFNKNPFVINANQMQVARINSQIICNANRFIFSSIKDFKYLNKKNEILSGSGLLMNHPND